MSSGTEKKQTHRYHTHPLEEERGDVTVSCIVNVIWSTLLAIIIALSITAIATPEWVRNGDDMTLGLIRRCLVPNNTTTYATCDYYGQLL